MSSIYPVYRPPVNRPPGKATMSQTLGNGLTVPRVPPVLPPGAPPPIVVPPHQPGPITPPGGMGPYPPTPQVPGGPAAPPGPPRGVPPPGTFGQGMAPAPAESRAIDAYTHTQGSPGSTGIANNPAVTAAINDFNLNAAPTIENQMALSGLGRTSATANALARGQAQMLTPLYQQSLSLADNAAARQAAAVQSQASMLLGYGQDQTNRLDTAIQQSLSAGHDERAIRQQYGDAAYNDFMRRQALSEESTYGPFGQTAGSMAGSLVRQSK